MSGESMPVLLVHGTDEFLKRRQVNRVRRVKERDGWTVSEIDGEESGVLDSVFSMSLMFGSNRLYIVSNPEKLPAKEVAAHIAEPDEKVILLLVSEAEKQIGEVLGLVPSTHVRTFNLPPFYKMEEYAAKFVVNEVKARGNAIEERLALNLVQKVGDDLGVLSYEVEKVCTLVGPGAEIAPAHLRGTLAALAETEGGGIVEALGAKDLTRLSAELNRYLESRGGDPTIELCGRVLTPNFVRWLQASSLFEAGMSPAAAAGSVAANPWYWEHKVLPLAMRWRTSGCARLLRIVAKAQTLVFSGAIAPFAFLESALLEAVQDG